MNILTTFNNFHRKFPRSKIKKEVIKYSENPYDLNELIFLIFHIRNKHNIYGYSEKTLNYFVELYYWYPDYLLNLVDLFPKYYGSWQDLNKIALILLEDKIELNNSNILEIEKTYKINLINRLINKIVGLYI